MSDQDDIIVWADGTWCYRYELHEFTWMSDDYTVIAFDSDYFREFIAGQL